MDIHNPHIKNKIKNKKVFFMGLLVCLVVRLIPFRAPNIEPVLVAQMPFAKAYGYVAGFMFGVLNILLYDAVTGTIGVWTLVTSATYGMIGILAAIFFKKRRPTRWNFFIFAVVGTILYDAVTGLSIGPLFFHQTFITALIGQIPFTGMHLLGNVSFSLLVSPALYGFLVEQSQTTEFGLRHQRRLHYQRQY